MAWAQLLNGRRKGLLSGLAALFVHGGVVWALPAAPSVPTRPQASELWLSAVVPPERVDPVALTGGEPAEFAAFSAHPARARQKPVRAHQAREHAASTREPALATEPVAAQPAAAQTEAASEPAPSTADVGAQLFAHAPAGGLGSPHNVSAGTGDSRAAVRGPGLLAVSNPCGGYFPVSAKADHGQVRVHVRVDQAGRASVTRVLTELPNGQEFGSAARACAAALRFQPATDGLGMPVPGDAKLELSFHRS